MGDSGCRKRPALGLRVQGETSRGTQGAGPEHTGLGRWAAEQGQGGARLVVDEQPGLSGIIRRRCGRPFGGTLGARLLGPLREVVPDGWGGRRPWSPLCPGRVTLTESPGGFGIPRKPLGSDVRKAGCSQAHDRGPDLPPPR